MENKKILENITVIVPVHELNDETTILLQKAVNSVYEQEHQVKIAIVCPKEIEDVILAKIEQRDDLPNTILINDGEIDFCSQINFAVSKIDTEYFSILELDDEYSKTYFNNVVDYSNEYTNAAAFLPVIAITNNNGQVVHFVNEGPWSQGFAEDIGKLDMAALFQYDSFLISGAVIKKEAFEEVGGLKKDIKVYFIYEFLLRFVNNDHQSVVIPKLGYKHLTGREGSLFQQYKDADNGIKPKEVKFYFDSAKREYFFNPNEIERSIEYSESETE